MKNRMKYKVSKFTLAVFVFIFACMIFSTSLSVRMWADDFCTAVVFKQNGFWGSQLFSWLTWSGRYSYNFFIYFFILFGSKIVTFVPIITFYLLAFSLWIVLTSVLSEKYKVQAFLFSITFLIVILNNTPNIVQSLYWFGGDLIYTFPFVFFNIFLIFLTIFPKKKQKVRLLLATLSFLVLFFATGFSESLIFPFLIFIGFGLIINNLFRGTSKRYINKTLLWGLGGVLMSFLLMYFSPGTAARSMSLDKPYNLLWVITSSFDSTVYYLKELLPSKPFWYSVGLVFSLAYYCVRYMAVFNKKILSSLKASTLVVVSTVAGILTVYSVYFISFYSMAYHPPERALIIPIYFIFIYMSVGFFAINYFVYSRLGVSSRRNISNFVFLVFVLSLVLLARDTYRRWRFLKNDLRTYADAWDIQEESIKQQKGSSSTIYMKYIPPVGRIDGFKDNKGWVTGCVAGFYGVDRIIVE